MVIKREQVLLADTVWKIIIPPIFFRYIRGVIRRAGRAGVQRSLQDWNFVTAGNPVSRSLQEIQPYFR